MRARRLLDSCILASTITTRPKIALTTALLPPAWFAPISSAHLAALLYGVGVASLPAPPLA